MAVIADRPNTRMIPALLSKADDDEAVVIRLDEQDAAVVLPPAQYQRFRRIAAAETFHQLSERIGRQAEENGLTQEILDEILAETKAQPTARAML